MDVASLLANSGAYLARGGWIMVLILGLSLWMWLLIGRQWHLLRSNSSLEKGVGECLRHAGEPGFAAAPWQLQLLEAAEAARSLRARMRKRYLEAQTASVSLSFQRHTGTILMLAGAAPLLGLLGTVTGMIDTFDIIAVHGTGNARGLASGISVALVTTQAGLVTSVPGLALGLFLRRRAARASERVVRFTHGLMLAGGERPGRRARVFSAAAKARSATAKSSEEEA
ncbi:MAG: MotA/TolQ/ExbB proton channel family protein [Desulfovibrionaceae bacterium]|jgi:biopolymer transport protein ExbB|nr:MotA/TolQ/ExbB proton channel family protein [Desulfovibrionaceae bacterium]